MILVLQRGFKTSLHICFVTLSKQEAAKWHSAALWLRFMLFCHGTSGAVQEGIGDLVYPGQQGVGQNHRSAIYVSLFCPAGGQTNKKPLL